MSLCSMCFQQRTTSPLYVGEHSVKVAEQVCRGCTMGIEKAINYISFRGFIVDLIRAPHLWSDAEDSRLRGEGDGSGLGESTLSPTDAPTELTGPAEAGDDPPDDPTTTPPPKKR